MGLRKFGVMSLAAALVATAASAIDWHASTGRAKIDGLLSSFAANCAELGFSRFSTGSAKARQDKLYSHLLLSPLADEEVEGWGSLIAASLADGDEAQDAERKAGDALLSAKINPSSLSEAEAVYVQNSLFLPRAALSACTRAAADPFISTMYVSGSGSLTEWEAKAHDSFKEGLKMLDGDK